MFGGLIMLLFWVLVIGAAIWLIATVARGGQATFTPHAPVQTPLEVLKVRYAKGEITKEQFDQMRQDLGA